MSLTRYKNELIIILLPNFKFFFDITTFSIPPEVKTSVSFVLKFFNIQNTLFCVILIIMLFFIEKFNKELVSFNIFFKFLKKNLYLLKIFNFCFFFCFSICMCSLSSSWISVYVSIGFICFDFIYKIKTFIFVFYHFS